MIQINNRGTYREIESTDGFIHRKGNGGYFKRCVMFPDETESDFDEVAEIPVYTKAEYDEKVAELVRTRYTASEEFAIQRKMINATIEPSLISEGDARAAIAEFTHYNDFVEQCKRDARNPELYKTHDNEQ